MSEHKKPTSPLAKIVFSDKGKVTKEVEDFPASKEEVEGVVVSKFAGALEKFTSISLEGLERSDPWPDYVATVSNQSVGIELTEVVRPFDAQRAAIQDAYVRALVEELEEFIPSLSGWIITMDDGYQDPQYPRVESEEGKLLIDFMCRKLKAEAPKLSAMNPGTIVARKWENVPGGYSAGFGGIRLSEHGSAQIRMLGTFPHEVQEVHSMLAASIGKKLDKGYGDFKDGELWLLVYDLSSPSTVWSEAAIAKARKLLATNNHFERVWSFFPYTGERSGSIKQVWPVP